MMDTSCSYHYVLSFKGWAQCRMATDPDPSNAPRGVSGYTFALPGEADLDQIIYFHDREGVIRRTSCPEIGVWVTGGCSFVTRNAVGPDQEAYVSEKTDICAGHPFHHAAVDLLNNPIFDSRNSTLIYNGYGLINPFNLQVQGDGVCISRKFEVNPDQPGTDLESVSIDQLTPYAMNIDVNDPPNMNDSTPGSSSILLESGILDQVAYRRRRLRALEAELITAEAAEPPDRNAVAALKKRIAELRIDDPVNRRTAQLGAKVLVPYNLNSQEAVVNGRQVAMCGAPWGMELWMGGFDADAMSFFVLGTVNIVLDFDPTA